jgi:hypothetical protein
VPADGGSWGRRGAEVEVGQRLAVGERPQEQLLRELLLKRRRRCRRRGGKEEEEGEVHEEDRPGRWRRWRHQRRRGKGGAAEGWRRVDWFGGCPPVA